MEMIKLMCDADAKLKTAQIPLRNDIIHDRIKDIPEYIRRQVLKEIQRSPTKISLQVDESTDI
jgi:hypothetical protein